MNSVLAQVILNGAIAGINALVSLGLERTRVHALIDKAASEGRPLTQAEVDAELDDWLKTIDAVEATLPANPATP